MAEKEILLPYIIRDEGGQIALHYGPDFVTIAGYLSSVF